MKNYMKKFVIPLVLTLYSVVVLLSYHAKASDDSSGNMRATSTAALFHLTEDDDTQLVQGSQMICQNVATDLQHIGMQVYNMPLPTVASMKNALATRNAVLVSCHAEEDSVNLLGGYLTSESISASANYSKCKLAFFSCCYVGADATDGDNLCETLIDVGVKSVVACTDWLGDAYARRFVPLFFDYIAYNRYNVGNALVRTKADLYSWRPLATESMVLFGNTSTVLP